MSKSIYSFNLSIYAFFVMFWDRNVIKTPAMRGRDEEAVALREK